MKLKPGSFTQIKSFIYIIIQKLFENYIEDLELSFSENLYFGGFDKTF